MKKSLTLLISIVLVMGVMIGLTSCGLFGGDGDSDAEVYKLDSSAFNATAVFGENLNLSGLKLVDEKGGTIDVTKDMVTGIDTKSAGVKQLTISYNEQTFTVDYTVKFRITFVIDGVESEQLVVDAKEIVAPKVPEIIGKQFDGWSIEIPAALTDNLRVEAIYKTLSTGRENAYTWTGEGVINLSGYVSAGSTVNCTVTDADGNALASSIASVDSAAGKINYSIGDNEVIIIAISGDGVMSKSWKIQKIEQPTLSIGDAAIGITLGDKTASQKVNVSSTPASFKYFITPSNANIGTAALNDYVFIDAFKAGVSEITVKAVNDTNELEFIELKQYVVVAPKTGTFTISNLNTEYGIENIWTVARENADKLNKFTAAGGNTENIGEGFFENISWVTNNVNVTVSKNGAITLENIAEDPDIVEIKAVFGFGGVTFESAPMKVRCVYQGINVYSYAELYSETVLADPRPIVLQANIKDDFSSTNYSWMKSNYDLTYYENIGASEDQKMIKVLMQFKDDVYGNGFEINAHNATIGLLDATGKPVKDKTLFWGPLNFVAMSPTASGGAISVKGQDNIVFGVHEGVTLNNIILKSCDLTAVDGKVDLTDLDYAGTTVEILGDGVTIEYSRLMNGRTVLRVFGDEVDSTQEINLEVKNTLLKASREFIARLGSNRFVYEKDVAAPYLPGDSESTKYYNTKNVYNDMNAADKAAYDEKYINTFVTFENCVFEDAGIFSIGLDSHFAGEALKNGSDYLKQNGVSLLTGWHDLAKTSYGVKLTFKEDVRLYSWKPLEDIDSSTLIDNNLTKNDTSDPTFLGLTFNVKALVENAASLPSYSNIVDTVDGKKYAHAGIAFFGGGKNYSVFENLLDKNAFTAEFSEYEVSLTELNDGERNQGYLNIAAGNEPFYFFIYNANSSFTYENQQTLENKYDVLRK